MKNRILPLLLAVSMLSAASLNTVAVDKKNNGRADVSLTMSSGSSFFCAANGEVMVMKELSVPYFDLALYGMEDYYYNPNCYDGVTDPNDINAVKNPGTKETAEGNVTLLHALIYATELYQLEMPEDEIGQGALYESGEMGDYLSISGGVGSIYFTGFWGGNSNMNYYINYKYPMSPVEGMGATADQILLEDDDHISIHRIADETWTKTGTSFGYLEVNGERNSLTVPKGEKLTLNLKHTARSWGTSGTEAVSVADALLYYSTKLSETPSKWTKLGKSDSNGQFCLDTANMAAGTYYIASDSLSVALEDGYSEPSPAVFMLTVEEGAVTYGDVNGDGKVNSNDASMALRYAANLMKDLDTKAADVNGDGKVNSSDASLILRYAANLITAFPVESNS